MSEIKSKHHTEASQLPPSELGDQGLEQAEIERNNRLDRMMRQRQEAFLEEEKTLLTWKAPARTFKKRSNEYFTTIGAIVLLVCIILLFIREFILMIVVIAFSFLAYVLATIEPEEVESVITSRGIRVNGKFYRWDILGRYWFSQEGENTILTVETFLNFPTQLVLIIDKENKDKIKELISPYVLFEKPEETFVDKASTWLREKMPLEG